MHSRFRMKGVLVAGLLALVASVALPHRASAEPEPGAKKKGFRLFARALGAMTVNRVYCGMASDGQICVDSSNSSTIGGGFWPKGTPDQYIFNSGLQVAGIISPLDGGPWAGDTVGGFFFDPKGTTQHGEEVQPIYNSSNPADLASWPEAACVPFNAGNPADEAPTLFNALLQTDVTENSGNYSFPCRKSASQGDVWFMSWEGNPSFRAGRNHPLGVMVETRGMGWNFPSGNEDVLYFIYTFYNVTSTNAADYSGYRPSMRPILLQKAQDFHASVAATGVTLPANGYTMTNLFAAFARDDDVGSAGANYSSVNLPFALGYTYDHGFSPALPGWKFDASIFSTPFFPGVGFTGAKYLKSPSGAGAIQLFSNTVNGTPFAGAVNDPRDVVQLYRYLSGTLSPATGDQSCNTGIQSQTRVCFVNNNTAADMRFFQSSTPLNLPPGGSGSIVVAYIFAPPVRVAGGVNNTDVKPGDPRRLTTPAQLTVGANLIDSMTGFRGWADANADGIPQQGEFSVVDKSLLGKAKTAQDVFDNKFLLPFAPSAPDFFLIPGDNQVTVLWKPSLSETTGDPFFAIANVATVPDPVTHLPSNNSLYDPNYRQFDVEGYRVYRGRVDAPNELVLLAQFDYAGTIISDYTGIVNPTANCAPEYAILTGCATLAPNLKNGTTLVNHRDVDLVGTIVETKSGAGRVPLASGLAQILSADTAVTGGGTSGSCAPRSLCPALANTGVPFSFVDQTPRNNFRYFYSVTAFDVNSIESGPTSLESPRITRSVRPVKAAGNFLSEGAISSHIVGRGVAMDTVIRNAPTLDPTTGTFSGPAQPADGASLNFAGQFVTRIFAAPGAVSAKLMSIALGDARNGVPVTYGFQITGSNGVVTNVTVALQQGLAAGNVTAQTAPAPFATADSALSADYRIPALPIAGLLTASLPPYQPLVAWGRGCADGAIDPDGNTCLYNNPRWFDADTSEPANPAANNAGATATVNLSNAGFLSGVATIYTPHTSLNVDGEWRQAEAVLGGAIRAADFKVYWGTAGKVDSVIDITHNVPVPFQTTLGGGFAILNQAGSNAAGSFDTRPGVLTLADFGCVAPFRGGALPGFTAVFPCTSAAPFTLTDVAVPGPMALHTNLRAVLTTQAPRPNPGFGMYLAGHIFMFEMAGATPPASTVWVLRSYAGTIFGGSGAGGDFGPYSFEPVTRPFTALGAEVQLAYSAQNSVQAPTSRDLRQVHTVPDPYYVTNSFEQSTDNKIIKFVNLPAKAIIRIYSSSGVLVSLLENPGPSCQNVNASGVIDNPTGGECTWNVRNRNNQVVASGVYFYHIEANGQGGTARRVGRMTIVNFAQ